MTQTRYGAGSAPPIAVLLLAVACAGCGPPSLERRLDRYEAAVAAAIPIDRPIVKAPSSASLRLPSRRTRHLATEPGRVGILEFLAIQGCRLGVLAGERTSPLGQQMEETRRLRYELDVLASAAPCIDAEDDLELKQKLGDIVRRKRRELPLHVWNAVWTGPEIEAYLEPTRRAFAPASGGAKGAARLGAVLASLDVAEPAHIDGVALEVALARLVDVAPLGPALHDLDTIRSSLSHTAGLLAPIGSGVRCDPVRSRLTSAFQDAWLAFVQRSVLAVHARARDELPLLERLYQVTASGVERAGHPVPADMVAWRAHVLVPAGDDAIWPAFETARDAHVSAWRPILVRCGVLPAAP